MTQASARHEEALTFTCEGEVLVGVLHHEAPPARPDAMGFVIVVGGPQYRAGSHRHFVTFARQMAAAGHPVLRFDVRGMGDSTGTLRTFEHITADIGAAIDALCARKPELRRLALWGLCDGASAALLYLQERRDPRVTALCLLNPWVRSEASQARTQVKHYYLDRIRQREFWVKLLSGRVAVSAVTGLLRSVKTAVATPSEARHAGAQASYQDRMLDGWQVFEGSSLLVLSGNDYTAREFMEYTSGRPQWSAARSRAAVRSESIAIADHTFSDGHSKSRLCELTLAWAGKMARTKGDMKATR